MQKDNREHSRVNTYMPFDARLLSPEEHSLRSRISDETPVIEPLQLPKIENKDLNEWLRAINSKLDMLLMFKQENFREMNFRPLNISASGMSFLSGQRFEIGDLLEIRIVLQVNPHKILYVIAAVLRVEQLSFKINNYNIAVKFLEMTDEFKNELLKYDFSRQMKFAAEK